MSEKAARRMLMKLTPGQVVQKCITQNYDYKKVSTKKNNPLTYVIARGEGKMCI